MAKKEKIEAMVEGGKATAAPPLGPALGPLGINIGQVISEINKKTEAFKGMKVPVKVIVDTATKKFEIEVGTPPVSQLIQKELSLEKGSGEPHINKIGNISIEEVIKIAKMKKNSMLVKSLKAAIKSIAGSCHAMGVLVEGKKSKEINADIDAGVYDDIITREIAEVSQEKKERLGKQLTEVQEALKKEQERLMVEEEKLKAETKVPVKEEAARAEAEKAEEVAGEKAPSEGRESKEEKVPEKKKPGKEAK